MRWFLIVFLLGLSSTDSMSQEIPFITCGGEGRSKVFNNVVTIFQHESEVDQECVYCRSLQVIYDDKGLDAVEPYATQMYITVIDPELADPLAQVVLPLAPLWGEALAPSFSRIKLNFESVASDLARLNVHLSFVGPRCESRIPECEQLVIKDHCSSMASALFQLEPIDRFPNSPHFP